MGSLTALPSAVRNGTPDAGIVVTFSASRRKTPTRAGTPLPDRAIGNDTSAPKGVSPFFSDQMPRILLASLSGFLLSGIATSRSLSGIAPGPPEADRANAFGAARQPRENGRGSALRNVRVILISAIAAPVRSLSPAIDVYDGIRGPPPIIFHGSCFAAGQDPLLGSPRSSITVSSFPPCRFVTLRPKMVASLVAAAVRLDLPILASLLGFGNVDLLGDIPIAEKG